jgi:SAM-dependent methyltransferase
MSETPIEYRFYGDAAPWWPLISPPAEYAEEAAQAAQLLRSAAMPVREVLELGSGGGNNASHLKVHFAMTLVDLSEDMLRVSRRLNPDCAHHQGDMRTVRLGRSFDAVFVHDAVDYMLVEEDLRLAIRTAYLHCRPGGVAVFLPDSTAEMFTPETDCGGSDGDDGRAARYLEWTWDPDPNDSSVQTEYVFVLRSADASIQLIHESHRTGLFARDVWLRLFAEEGFAPEIVPEVTDDDRPPRELFLARRPI